jgi:hypothetical protein
MDWCIIDQAAGANLFRRLVIMDDFRFASVQNGRGWFYHLDLYRLEEKTLLCRIGNFVSSLYPAFIRKVQTAYITNDMGLKLNG